MVLVGLLYAVIVFIVVVLLEIFGYQAYILNKNTLRAYLTDLKNKNPELLVKTKCDVLKKERVRILKAMKGEEEIDVIVDGLFVDDLMMVKKVYYDVKHNKYDIFKAKDSWEDCEITPIKEIVFYQYNLKDRDYKFEKESGNLFVNKEQVLFKNPFTGEYFWEKELDGREYITEIDLMNRVPKKLDIYLFNFSAMEKILTFTGKSFSDLIGIFSIIASIFALIAFISKILL